MPTRTFLAGACALAAITTHAQADAPVQIEMRAIANATTEQVVLGDLAIVRTHDAATIRDLVALPLGERPSAGGETTVRRDAIARWVRVRLGLGRSDVDWNGAAETIVRTPVQELQSHRIEKVASSALAGWIAMHAPGSRAEVLPAAGVKLPAGDVALAARSPSSDLEHDRRNTLLIDVAVDGRVVRTVPVAFVLHSQVAQPGARLVSRGEWVSLHVKSAGLDVESRVQALQDGVAGQVVRVRSASASAPISVRVVAAGQVAGEP